MTERRPATVADCAGCRNDKFNGPNRRCWSLVHARIVPKWRRNAESDAPAIAVMVPQCYSTPGFIHFTRAGESRSQWESGV